MHWSIRALTGASSAAQRVLDPPVPPPQAGPNPQPHYGSRPNPTTPQEAQGPAIGVRGLRQPGHADRPHRAPTRGNRWPTHRSQRPLDLRPGQCHRERGRHPGRPDHTPVPGCPPAPRSNPLSLRPGQRHREPGRRPGRPDHAHLFPGAPHHRAPKGAQRSLSLRPDGRPTHRTTLRWVRNPVTSASPSAGPEPVKSNQRPDPRGRGLLGPRYEAAGRISPQRQPAARFQSGDQAGAIRQQ